MTSPDRTRFPLHRPVCKLGGIDQFIPFISFPFCYLFPFLVTLAVGQFYTSGLWTGWVLWFKYRRVLFRFPDSSSCRLHLPATDIPSRFVSRSGICWHRRQVYTKDGGWARQQQQQQQQHRSTRHNCRNCDIGACLLLGVLGDGWW